MQPVADSQQTQQLKGSAHQQRGPARQPPWSEEALIQHASVGYIAAAKDEDDVLHAALVTSDVRQSTPSDATGGASAGGLNGMQHDVDISANNFDTRSTSSIGGARAGGDVSKVGEELVLFRSRQAMTSPRTATRSRDVGAVLRERDVEHE